MDGRIYEGLAEGGITRSLRDIAGDFELSLTRKWTNASEMVIKPLSACTVHIGNDLVLTGYVDDFIPSYDAREVSWVVSGRNKTSDLVDCSAIYKTGQWTNVTLDRVARDICAPFGIDVVVECDLGDAFPRVAIEQGRPVSSCLTAWPSSVASCSLPMKGAGADQASETPMGPASSLARTSCRPGQLQHA